MQTLILVIFVLSILSFVLQLGLFPKKLPGVFWLVVLGVFVYAAHPWTIELSYKVFELRMADVGLMGNFTVILVIEAIGSILFSIFLIRYAYGEPVRQYFRCLIYLPGVVIFPALYYIGGYVFLQQAGMDFSRLAMILALSITIALALLWGLIRWLVPEYDLRLELKFILHVLQLLMAIILAESLLGLPVRSQGVPPSMAHLATILLGALALAVMGFLWQAYRRNKKTISKH